MKQIQSSFLGKDIVSIDQFDKASIEKVHTSIEKIKRLIKKKKHTQLLKGRLVTLLFFEPSSRTFSSFSAAVKLLGGVTIEHQNPFQTSSVVKGETLEDTIQVFQNYSDAIVIRHPENGSVLRAADAATLCPVINAGDGSGEHPTQALMDLYTIKSHTKRLNHLKGLIAGDLLYGRTVHSLIRALSYFKGNTLYLLTPPHLQLSKKDREAFEKKDIELVSISSEKDIPTDCDFWYWTRVQKERFKNLKEYEKLKSRFILSKKLLENKGNKKLILLHPLPRVGEIELAVDADARALYLNEQIQNGLYTRMALLSLIFGKL